MTNLIRDIFLGDFFIFIMLFLIFAFFSYWSLFMLKEYAGYALGLIASLFLLVVYVALVGETRPPSADSLNTAAPLGFFGVTIPLILGLIGGYGTVRLIRMPDYFGQQRPLKVAILIAAPLIIGFIHLVVLHGRDRQMIGILTYSWLVAVLFTYVLTQPRFGRHTASAAPPPVEETPSDAPPFVGPSTGGGASRLDRMRDQMRRR